MKRNIRFGLILLLLLTGLLAGCGQNSQQIEVTTAAAKTEGDLSDLSWNGTIQALHQVDVVPGGTGKVTSIAVAEGQTVHRGATLFTLDTVDAQLQVKQAQAGLNAANAALNSAAASRAQNTAVLPAQIAYDDAKANYDRIDSLYQAGAASKVDRDSAKSKMDTAYAQLEAAQLNENSTYDNAQAQAASAKANLDIAAKRLSDCTVTAPIDGRITKVNVEVGALASAQAPAVTIVDDSGEEVVIQVTEGDLGRLAAGTPMEIRVQALNETLAGSVSEIATAGDPATGMFDVKVLLNAPGPEVLPGMTASVRAAGSSPSTAVYVPAKSVHSADSGETWVYLAKDYHAVKQAVTAGSKKNAYVEITKGLTAGDSVIVQNSGTLKDGVPIRIITAESQQKEGSPQ